MNCNAYVARAFCHNGLGGNPAGVVIVDQESEFTSEKKQAIASHLNFSETVFLTPLKNSSYQARYYTPNSPIDFCGHATLAAFGVLKMLGSLNGSEFTLETLAGRCKVTLKENMFFLSQQQPVFGGQIDQSEISSALGNYTTLDNPPPQIVSTGLPDIFVCVEDEATLSQIEPDLKRMTELNQKTHTVGMHVFTLCRSESIITARCRNFAPLYGIDEESATGSSNGALATLLFKQGLLPSNSEHKLLFRQGESLNAPSDIYVHLSTNDKTILKVECGGEVIIDEERKL